jgi:hypothetical protein
MLQLPAGVVKCQELRGVQTFSPEAAVECLTVGVVGRLARPAHGPKLVAMLDDAEPDVIAYMCAASR